MSVVGGKSCKERSHKMMHQKCDTMVKGATLGAYGADLEVDDTLESAL